MPSSTTTPMSAASLSTSRRSVLKGGGAALATGFAGTIGALSSQSALAAVGKQQVSAVSPYGPISPVNDLATGLPLLQLPAGFSFKSFGWTGDLMADGRPTPSSHDGMAVVATRRVGRSTEHVLVRNHERGLAPSAATAVVAPANYATGMVNGIITIMYGTTPIRIGASGTVTNPTAPDPTPFVGVAGGGTTNLVFRDAAWSSSTTSIGGTLGNCAGGLTPWGSWLTCEETILDFSGIGGSKHGYIFESAPNPNASVATPIVGMGRFAHEAVAVDPSTGTVYETEDNRNLSAFFRYVPVDTLGAVGSLQRGGVLQAARIKTIVRQATPTTLAQANDVALLNPDIGDEYVLEWVNINDPDASPQVVAGQPGGITLGFMSGPAFEALGKGCARMSRGEGIWYANGKMLIVDTAAGLDSTGRPGRGEGALWELELSSMRLRALFVSGNQTAGNNPDNVTVSPRGGVVLCEDGGGSTDVYGTGARLLGLNAASEAYIFCKNNSVFTAAELAAAGKTVAAGDYRGVEFAGACFDPTGRILFVNIQTPGITLAITGPWAKGNL